MNFSKTILAAVMAMGVMQGAQATVITFEGVANTIYDAPITRSGFQFGNVAGTEQHFHEIDSTQYGLISNGTGILLNDRDSSIYTKLFGGGTFLANSIDVTSSGDANQGSSLGLTIEGFLNNVSAGLINVSFGIGDPFQTVSLLSLGTVDTIVFDGVRGGFELDNATFNQSQNVPEPASWALLGIGLAAIRSLSRRKAR